MHKLDRKIFIWWHMLKIAAFALVLVAHGIVITHSLGGVEPTIERIKSTLPSMASRAVAQEPNSRADIAELSQNKTYGCEDGISSMCEWDSPKRIQPVDSKTVTRDNNQSDRLGPFREGIWQASRIAPSPMQCDLKQDRRYHRKKEEVFCAPNIDCTSDEGKTSYVKIGDRTWLQKSSKGNAKDYEVTYVQSSDGLAVFPVSFQLTSEGEKSPQREWYFKMMKPAVMSLKYYFCGLEN